MILEKRLTISISLTRTCGFTCICVVWREATMTIPVGWRPIVHRRRQRWELGHPEWKISPLRCGKARFSWRRQRMRAARRVGETFGLRAMAPFGLRARTLRATVSGTFWLKTSNECFFNLPSAAIVQWQNQHNYKVERKKFIRESLGHTEM